MGVLTAVPNEEGVAILKQELFSKIKKFALVDDSGEVYFTDTVHSIYFDSDGVLTVSALIPKEELMWLHLFILRIFSNSEIKYQYE